MSINNVSKLLTYMIPVSKKPIIADGKQYYKPVKKIMLANTFFNSDRCQVCGNCCIPEDNIWTKWEYDKIMTMTLEEFQAEGFKWFKNGFNPELLVKVREGIKEETHEINGKEVKLWRYPNEPVDFFRDRRYPKPVTKPSCTWIGTQKGENYGSCTIHPISSTTCKIPHMRFFHNKSGTVSIGTADYGRGWIINCPAIKNPPIDEEEFIQHKEEKLEKFEMLRKVAIDLNCEDNYIEDIIKYIKSIPYENYQEYLCKNIIPQKNSFSEHNMLQED